ncbi:MAG TPA: MogA/MoaB family molybdenum cofactor biosynthesis protein [Clostridia bacterium]|nr:MogA/MoaB family molybdenum cofactor biosynthesis protein [Clostridia bacterium]
MRKVGIIVASDKCYEGLREDKSGKAIARVMADAGYAVEEILIVPDEFDRIKSALLHFTDELKLPIVLTTGGTGFSPRDITPEATRAVIEREAQGIAEAIRAKSMAITDRAMLSRAISGIRKSTLIINLPGSEKAVCEALEFVVSAVSHGLDVLLGEASECAR